MVFENWTKAKKMHHGVLLVGMIATVITFNVGREVLAAVLAVFSIATLHLIDRRSERPVYDERDITIAEESTHTAVMWAGVLGGTAMIIISLGMGLRDWGYPDWIAPYYLTWGGIVGLTMLIEVLKRYKVIE